MGRQYAYPVGQEHRFLNVVGYENNGLVGFPPDPQQIHMEFFSRKFIQCGKGLVHQQDLRPDRQGSCNAHSLLHAAAELPGIMIRKIRQSHELEHLIRPLDPICLGHLHDLQRQHDVFPDGAPVIQHCTLEHHAVPLLEPCRPGRFPANLYCAGGRLQQICNDPQQGGLAAAGRPQQGNKFSLLDIQRYAGQGCHILSVRILIYHTHLIQHDLHVVFRRRQGFFKLHRCHNASSLSGDRRIHAVGSIPQALCGTT